MQIIFAGQKPTAPLTWVRVADGRVQQSGEADDLQDFAARFYSPAVPLTLVLPGEQFACRTVMSPAKTRKQLLQTAKYLLEDELAGSPEQMHIAVAGDIQAASKKIIAVDKAFFDEWVEGLTLAGLSADRITVDYLCLPVNGGETTSLKSGGRLLFASRENGFAVEERFGEELISSLIQEQDEEHVAYVHGADSGDGHQLADREAVIALLVASMETMDPPDLLQGEYAEGINWLALAQPWRLAGMIAAACALLFLTTTIAEGMRLDRAATELNAASAEKLQAAYPEARVTNLRAAARQRAGVSDVAASDHFLPLMAILSGAIEQSGNVELTQVTYTDDGQLAVDVRVADVEQLDQLKERLRQTSIQVDEGRTLTPDGDAFSGKLFLRAAS
jgi:general secretion pathway protein L